MQMALRLIVVGLAAGFLGFIACGSPSDDGLLSGTSGGGTSATGGVGGSSGSGGSAGSGNAAGTGGVQEDSGIDASGGASGGASGAAGGSSDGGAGGAAGSSPTDKGVGPCGSKVCAYVAGDYCCKPSAADPYCANDDLGNPCKCSTIACNTLDLHCDGPEDCPSGQICCGDTGFFGGGYDVVECRDNCLQTGIGGPQREVCHPGGQACKHGGSCQPDPGLPAGYFSCQ